MIRKIAFIMCLALVVPLAAQQARPDALRSFRNGRDLDARGRTAEARTAYQQAETICRQELSANPRNIESYVVLGWSLFRLNRYQEAVNISLEALKINSREFRIIENLGECYFYLGNYPESLRMMERYIDGLPGGERVSTAYFFVGEIFRLTRRFNHAEIAYSAAVYKEPAVALWWYRLATVRETVEDKTGAKTAYERALRLNPSYKEASDGLSRVSS
ncbi:MAG: tetratricopeptide repeat protein [Spirochaetaceae bacterium]|jgi:tetratricopeptide (TPR) repeat protein|nr:tetratricopeptide repeat protein [Spirochaetaceae bacterium]